MTGGLSSSKRGKLLEIDFDDMTNLLENQVAHCISTRKNQPCTADKSINTKWKEEHIEVSTTYDQQLFAGVCASSIHKWNKLCVGNVDEDVRVMTRKSVDDPSEPPGIVVSAATSVWLPVSPQRLFDFLRDERLSERDILSNGSPMQEMAHIAKGQDHGNCVSLIRASVIFLTLILILFNKINEGMNASRSSMLVLRETCIDASESLVVYAPVDIPTMHLVMNGADSAYVALLPSGFSIVPDGPGSLDLNMVKDLANGHSRVRGLDQRDDPRKYKGGVARVSDSKASPLEPTPRWIMVDILMGIDLLTDFSTVTNLLGSLLGLKEKNGDLYHPLVVVDDEPDDNVVNDVLEEALSKNEEEASKSGDSVGLYNNIYIIC
ncbi:hypothetical protein HAX54_014351 [Datura stramonium]|uniref:HD-Zip IV C-terminal domain-containing protein n=1 Tax=Datura stramonium TaxID=4076 RepID=A0ABS8TPY9_DATST|nr:hypothetical protein [Datura stramonium]